MFRQSLDLPGSEENIWTEDEERRRVGYEVGGVTEFSED